MAGDWSSRGGMGVMTAFTLTFEGALQGPSET